MLAALLACMLLACQSGPSETAGEAPSPADVTALSPPDQQPRPLNLKDIYQELGYPQAAYEAGIEGKVVVKVLIDEQGQYVQHELLEEGHALLATEVAKHLPKLQFEAAQKDGKPVQAWVSIPFVFKKS
ncbi:MAG: energy transducer TonB [Bacteroidetes bacterium]|nr:MAG: energy transducer TonB [Bacteroidota bacterium]